MYFSHDVRAALSSAAALINTARAGDDALQSPVALDRFLDLHVLSGRRDGTRAELKAMRALRDELREIWCTEDLDSLVLQVNALLARTEPRPHLVRHDGWDWHLHVAGPHSPLVDRIGAEAAMAFVEVVRRQDMHRLRVCAAQGCRAVLVDLSRNSSRRYCDTGNCANRTHVAAYRSRRRSAILPPDAVVGGCPTACVSRAGVSASSVDNRLQCPP